MQNKKIQVGLAVLATGIMSFSGVLIETAMNVTFPDLIKEFGITTSMVQWVTTIYLLMISIMVPLSNDLMKRFSIRRLFILANGFFLAGVVIDFLAPTFFLLLFGRLLQGVSTGIALPLMFHIILNYSPIEKRGTMIGIGTLTTSIAPAIGPTYGGFLASNFSWHMIYACLIPILLLSLIIGLKAIPDISVKTSQRLDSLGLVGIGICFSGILLFFNQLDQWIGFFWFILGLVGFGLFFYQAKRSPAPLVRLTILKNKGFRLFLMGFLMCQFLLLGISFILPNFVQIVLQRSSFIAGLVMLPGAVIGALLAPLAGKLLDRKGPKKPILWGLILASIGWLGLALVTQTLFIWGLVVGHVTYMIGNGLCYSNMMTMGMSQIEEEDYGDGNTIFNTLQQFSGAVATTIVATIIGFFQKQSSSTFIEGTIKGSFIALIVLLILLVLVLLSCLRYFNLSKRERN